MSLLSDISGSRPWVRVAALVGVVAIPLGFAGLTMASYHDVRQDVHRVPAAIVDDDQFVTTTAADGTKTQVLAGRLLVTELTGDRSPAYDWVITNSEDASTMLEDGDVSAVVTIPAGFSKAITSLRSGGTPRRAQLRVATDGSGDALTSAVMDTLTQGLAATFGRTVTQQYIQGLSSGLGQLAHGLDRASGSAADLQTGASQLRGGATGLQTGASSLSAGLGQLGTGVTAARSGAGQLASGVQRYTGGVDTLSAGLQQLDDGAQGLSQISAGVQQYTGGINTAIGQVRQQYDALDPTDPQQAAIRQTLGLVLHGTDGQPGLDSVEAAGTDLSSATTNGIQAVRSGIAQSAAGAAQLAANSSALDTGAAQLASGLGQISHGVDQSTSGAGQLAAGAGTLVDSAGQLGAGSGALAHSLHRAAGDIPASATDPTLSRRSAAVAADPIVVESTVHHPLHRARDVAAIVFIPVGMWVGALALFMVVRPIARRVLASSASTGRLVRGRFARAGIVAVAQAVVLAAVLAGALGVSPSTAVMLVVFAIVMGLSFVLFHQALTTAFGRLGLVVSLFLLALQVAAGGALFPSQLLTPFFAAIGPVMPLGIGAAAVQALVTGGPLAPVGTAVVCFAVLGALSLALTGAVTASRRSARGIGLVVDPAGRRDPLPTVG